MRTAGGTYSGTRLYPPSPSLTSSSSLIQVMFSRLPSPVSSSLVTHGAIVGPPGAQLAVGAVAVDPGRTPVDRQSEVHLDALGVAALELQHQGLVLRRVVAHQAPVGEDDQGQLQQAPAQGRDAARGQAVIGLVVTVPELEMLLAEEHALCPQDLVQCLAHAAPFSP